MPSHSLATTESNSTIRDKKRTVSASSSLSALNLKDDDFANLLHTASKPRYPTSETGAPSCKRRFSEASHSVEVHDSPGGLTEYADRFLARCRREADAQTRAADAQAEARNRTTNSYLNNAKIATRHHTLPLARSHLPKTRSGSQVQSRIIEENGDLQECNWTGGKTREVMADGVQMHGRARSSESPSAAVDAGIGFGLAMSSRATRRQVEIERDGVRRESDEEEVPLIDGEENDGDGHFPTDYDNSFEPISVRVNPNPPRQKLVQRANDEIRLEPLAGSDYSRHDAPGGNENSFRQTFSTYQEGKKFGSLDCYPAAGPDLQPYKTSGDSHQIYYNSSNDLQQPQYGKGDTRKSERNPENAMAVTEQTHTQRVPRRKRNRQNNGEVINVTEIAGWMGTLPVEEILWKIEGNHNHNHGQQRRESATATRTTKAGGQMQTSTIATAGIAGEHQQLDSDCNGSSHSPTPGTRLPNDAQRMQGNCGNKKVQSGVDEKKSTGNDHERGSDGKGPEMKIDESHGSNAPCPNFVTKSRDPAWIDDNPHLPSADALDVDVDDEEQYMSADEGLHSPPGSATCKSTRMEEGDMIGRDLLIDGGNFRADDEPVTLTSLVVDEAEFIPVQSKHKRRQTNQVQGTRTGEIGSEKHGNGNHRNANDDHRASRPLNDSCESGVEKRRNSLTNHLAIDSNHRVGSVSHHVQGVSPRSDEELAHPSTGRRASIDSKKQSYSAVAGRRPMPAVHSLGDFIDDSRIKHEKQRNVGASSSTTRGSSLQTSRTTSPDRRHGVVSSIAVQHEKKDGGQGELRLVHVGGERGREENCKQHGEMHGSFAKALLSPPLPPAVRAKPSGDLFMTSQRLSEREDESQLESKYPLLPTGNVDPQMTAVTATASGTGARSWADIAKSKSPTSTTSSRASIAASSERDLSPDAPHASDRSVSAASSISARDDTICDHPSTFEMMAKDGGENAMMSCEMRSERDALAIAEGIAGISFFYDPNEAMPAPADPIPMQIPGKEMREEARGEEAHAGLADAMDGQTPVAGSPMFYSLAGSVLPQLPSPLSPSRLDDLNTSMNEKTLVGRTLPACAGVELKLADGRTVMLAPAVNVRASCENVDRRHKNMANELAAHWERFLKGERESRVREGYCMSGRGGS